MPHKTRRYLAMGALAGLIGGLAFGMVMVHLGMLPLIAGLLRSDSPTVGFMTHMLIAVIIGALYGALFRSRSEGYGANLMAGLAYGLIWWALGALTLLPVLLGHSVRWSPEAAQAAFPSLIGHLIYGGVAGLAFQFFADVLGLARLEAAETPVKSVSADRPRVLILGGGFAGVTVAQALEQLLGENDAEIVLVSNHNYLLFTPMLPEVSSSSIEARHITTPLRAFFHRSQFQRGLVEAIDVVKRTVTISHCEACDSRTLSFDHLVLALGSVPEYFGMADVQTRAFPLKTLDDAVRLRDHIIDRLEHAAIEPDAELQRRMLTVVVGGGGFAGAETIAELYDFVLNALSYYPNLSQEDVRFVLVHADDRILPEIGEQLAGYALEKLRDRGIEVRLDTQVTGIDGHGVRLSTGDDLPADTLIWTAGVRANPLLETLPHHRNRRGAIIVDAYLSASDQFNVWAVGDCAHITDPVTGQSYPPTAQHALQEAKTVAWNIAATLQGGSRRAFKYSALGVLVALGHRTAVAEVFGLQFSGLLAWLLWRGVYLSKLPGLERKIRVALDWLADLVFPRDIVQTGLSGQRWATSASHRPVMYHLDGHAGSEAAVQHTVYE